MYNKKKENEDFYKKQAYLIKSLEEAGIKVTKGRKIPENGLYSGLIGNEPSVIELKIPHWYNFVDNQTRRY